MQVKCNIAFVQYNEKTQIIKVKLMIRLYNFIKKNFHKASVIQLESLLEVGVFLY